MESPLRAAAVARIVEETGIDEATIYRLVHAFYDRVRQDFMLGPIFARRIADWEPHLARMCDFWSSVVLMTGRYHGQPMPAHMPLPIEARHFDRWLELFEETAREVCARPSAAAFFIDRAQRIASSLELSVAAAHGTFLAPGQRYGNTETASDN